MDQITPKRRRAPLVAIAAAAAACSGTPDLRIDGAEARLSPSLVGAAAVYLAVKNAGDGDDALVAAAVELPGTITRLHAIEDGRMVERARLVVPARGALALRPGGAHLMVFQLPDGVAPGGELTLRLSFERSGERRAAVRIVGGTERKG